MLTSSTFRPFNAMPKIPLMDYVGRPLLACVLLALLCLQWRFPLRRQHFSVLHRLVRNFVLSIPGFAIVRLAMLPIPIAVGMWAQDRDIGLLNWIPLTGWAAGVATFLLMDYAYWWWHWANHMIPLFWRFHNVHHTDRDPISSFQLATACLCGTDVEPRNCYTAYAWYSSFDRATRDQFQLGHDFFLVGQTPSDSAPRCASGGCDHRRRRVP